VRVQVRPRALHAGPVLGLFETLDASTHADKTGLKRMTMHIRARLGNAKPAPPATRHCISLASR
jgi:hypothetical protein